MRTKVRTRSILYLLLNVLVWGAALPIVKIGLEFTTPFRYLFYRFLFASLLSLPILWHFAPSLRRRGALIKHTIGLELIGTTLALGLLYLGLERTGAIQASLIVMTTPPFITLGGMWFLHEREELRESLGLGAALLGTAMLVLLPATGEEVLHFAQPGLVLLLFQNIATACYFLLAKRYYKNQPKFLVSTISFFVGAFSFALLSLWEVHWSIGSLGTAISSDLSHISVWVVAIYMAVFGSIIGLTAYIKGQDGIEASEASLFGYLQPLIFVPLGFFLLREVVQPIQFFALGIIIIGVFIAQQKKRKLK